MKENCVLIWIIFQDEIAIGLVFSVLFQETFRFLIYLLLHKADAYLKKLTENEETQIFANKHILAYVVGLGFGLMSGAFSLVNVLAASLGPGTLGRAETMVCFTAFSLKADQMLIFGLLLVFFL